MYHLRQKIWLEKNGVKAFGKGPAELLEGVRRTGSLSDSAKSMNMSYNKAYNLIKELEKALGFQLIIAQKGGVKGGSSELTAEAEALIEKYRAFETEAEACLHNLFKNHFD